jgi:hypothetical protein
MLLAGCTGGDTHPSAKGTGAAKSPATAAQDENAKIQAALAKLSPEDRKLAEAQKWCAVETENRLGEMGTPIKVMVNDQPVFLCCKGCQKTALEDPDRTLAKVEELKKAAGTGGQ